MLISVFAIMDLSYSNTNQFWQLVFFTYLIRLLLSKLLSIWNDPWKLHLQIWFFFSYITKLQPINDLDFHPQGTILISGAKDQTIKYDLFHNMHFTCISFWYFCPFYLEMLLQSDMLGLMFRFFDISKTNAKRAYMVIQVVLSYL